MRPTSEDAYSSMLSFNKKGQAQRLHLPLFANQVSLLAGARSGAGRHQGRLEPFDVAIGQEKTESGVDF